MAIGILDYAWYIPKLRISREEYASAWGGGPTDLLEKAVADFDEDTVTMAVESAKGALKGIDPTSIDVLCLASTNLPYAYRMVAGTLVDALGLRHSIFCTEHSQSARAGTEAFLSALAMLQPPRFTTALIVAADAPRGDMRDMVERGLGAASVAFVMGEGEIIAEIEGQASFVYEHLGETFRPMGSTKVEDLGMRGYHRDALRNSFGASVNALFKKLENRPGDYKYFAFQQTEDARETSLSLGFTRNQIDPVFLMPNFGDTGACSTLLALARALTLANPNERILVASYAPGAGSDAISIRTTDVIRSKLKMALMPESKEYVNYVTYLKIKEALS